MADWFKFYENDLDETRLQYAINKLPEVVSVWVGILSEACRHKSGTIRWGDNAIELFGFSHRLGISIGKVNEAVNLLVEIDYITKAEGMINVLKWSKKQSEYCQNVTRKQTQCRDSVGIVSGHYRESVVLEERRGEENIREGEPPIFNGKLKESERITFEKSLDRVESRLKELREADLPEAVAERLFLKSERRALLQKLSLKA